MSGQPRLSRRQDMTPPDEAPFVRARRGGTRGRTNDPEATQRNILMVATAEFADKGFSGARVDEIAALTNTSKRMIYYYFGDKEGLFIAVLEDAYRRIRGIEATLNLDHLDPEAALRALVGFTFDYQNANEDFVRLVMVENIHKGVHLARSKVIQELNVSVIESIRSIYKRGVSFGVFRDGIDEIDLHMSISALCFFNVANRSTFSRIFKREMTTPQALARRREIVTDTILRFVSKGEPTKGKSLKPARLQGPAMNTRSTTPE